MGAIVHNVRLCIIFSNLDPKNVWDLIAFRYIILLVEGPMEWCSTQRILSLVFFNSPFRSPTPPLPIPELGLTLSNQFVSRIS
ncbi:hypothetical protein GDO78_005236 [Eleutherodactylus coqui]|uniref:Uncharacterized protein n=1 Tax=Eleutherodactylus coqui TaxID=57060 RepID=A0A8J6FLJ9_ELECQ|nr:hypothetical protein GDO78_005236 [Eleutherodactylus coqui]